MCAVSKLRRELQNNCPHCQIRRECQAQHWSKGGHKVECKVLKAQAQQAQEQQQAQQAEQQQQQERQRREQEEEDE